MSFSVNSLLYPCETLTAIVNTASSRFGVGSKDFCWNCLCRFCKLLRRLSVMAFSANSLLYPCETLTAIVNSVFL